MSGAAEARAPASAWQDDGRPAPLSSWLAMAAMLLVGVYAVVDRQVFILVNDPIRAELSLDDTQMGMLQGLGLALVSLVTTYPIAWLSDRFDRRLISAACIVAWSAAVAACGLAPNFGWLLAGASLVGIGEAGISPAVGAMMPDLFPASRLQLANSVYVLASRLTGSLAVGLTGWMVSLSGDLRPHLPATLAGLSDWRVSLLAAVSFMPAAVALMLTLPRRASGLAGRGARAAGPAEAADLLPFLRQHAAPQFGVLLGMALAVFGFSCTAIWIPVIASRFYGQTPIEAGAWLGTMGLVTGVVGFAAGVPVLRWLRPRLGARMPIAVLTGVLLSAIPCSAVLLFADGVTMLYGAWGVQVTFQMIASMILPSALQMMAPRHLRARLFALLAIFSTVGGAVSPVVVGIVSDAISGTARPLLYAAMGTSIVAFAASAAVFWSVRRGYERMVAEVGETA